MAKKCMLCCSSETEDPLSFGRTIEEGNIMVHHNCLYLSSNLVQRGNNRVGILRFLVEDIFAEARRCSHLICVYCQRPGANIGCCKSGCRRTFHTKCGIDHLAQNQFRGTYKSYCHRHVKTHRRRPTSADTICTICTELLVEEGERFNVVNMLYSPCCRNGWYHRRCLQMYANTSGYFFKCPLCNNNEEFHDVSLWGVALSSQDASWETEPNAFAEHFRRDMVCVAEECMALAGRADNSILLLYCNTCGSNPAHALCIGQAFDSYVCHVCAVVSPVAPSLVESENESMNSDDSDTFESFAQAASNHTPPRNHNATTLTTERDNVQPKLHSSGWDLNDGDDTEDDDEVFQRVAEIQERHQTIAELPEDSSDEQPSTSAAAAQLVVRRSTRSTAASGSSRAAPRRSSLRLLAQNNQENTEPASSSSQTSRRSMRSRRTMPARMLDTDDESDTDVEKKNKRKPKKRAASPSPPAMRANRRSLRSITPNASNVRNIQAITPEPRMNDNLCPTTPEAAPSRSNAQSPPGRNMRRRTVADSNPTRNMDVSCVANRTRNRLPSYMAHRK
ncbi:PHD finger protein 7 [Drosophila subpulchrella]|uniref:PHD finger protein 7 n=1 Tax=Drosophila subpulchrella TaxID=1486046 RepID=UPI0018A15EC9|nr:PHD finger protein 7 [Drosophila subpulchrella]